MAVGAVHVVLPDGGTVWIAFDTNIAAGANGDVDVVIRADEDGARAVLPTFGQIGDDALDGASFQIFSQSHTGDAGTFANVEEAIVHDQAGRAIEVAGNDDRFTSSG